MRISYTCIPGPNVEEIDLTRAGRLRPNSVTKVNVKPDPLAPLSLAPHGAPRSTRD